MRYKFGNDNIITGYIKNLLHEFNLPQAKVITKDTVRYDGKYYIDNRKIYYGKEKTPIGVYSFGEPVPNLTKNLIINSSVYDSYTHNYLGDFLRFIRDYHKLDLMPLYNCFSNESPYNLRFTLDVPLKKKDGSDDNYYFKVNTSSTLYKYYIVPIKFDTTYNIAIESQLPYEICAMIYMGSERIKLSNQLMRETYKLVKNSRFSNPYTFEVSGSDVKKPRCNNLRYSDYEENLRLLIKLPSSVKTSITIIEGKLTNTKPYGSRIPSKIVYNEEDSIKLADGTYVRPDYTDLVPSTNLSLLSINDGNSYPFADRLVEYLLRNAINNTEKLQYNISRVQSKLYPQFGEFKGFYDVWNMDINYRIHDFLNEPMKNVTSIIGEKSESSSESSESPTKSYKDYTDDGKLLADLSKVSIGSNYKDLLGYVDKDVEYHLEAL